MWKLLISVLCCSAFVTKVVCDLTCPKNDDVDNLVYLPSFPKENCARYNLCWQGIPQPMECSGGLYFDMTSKTCTSPQQSSCRITDVTCSEQHEFLKNPRNCYSYYQCINGFPHFEECGEGQHFLDGQCVLGNCDGSSFEELAMTDESTITEDTTTDEQTTTSEVTTTAEETTPAETTSEDTTTSVDTTTAEETSPAETTPEETTTSADTTTAEETSPEETTPEDSTTAVDTTTAEETTPEETTASADTTTAEETTPEETTASVDTTTAEETTPAETTSEGTTTAGTTTAETTTDGTTPEETPQYPTSTSTSEETTTGGTTTEGTTPEGTTPEETTQSPTPTQSTTVAPTSTTTDPSTTEFPPVEVEDICKDVPVGVFPHPHNCYEYFVCFFGLGLEASCGADRIFDPKTLICVPGDQNTCEASRVARFIELVSTW